MGRFLKHISLTPLLTLAYSRLPFEHAHNSGKVPIHRLQAVQQLYERAINCRQFPRKRVGMRLDKLQSTGKLLQIAIGGCQSHDKADQVDGEDDNHQRNDNQRDPHKYNCHKYPSSYCVWPSLILAALLASRFSIAPLCSLMAPALFRIPVATWMVSSNATMCCVLPAMPRPAVSISAV